MEEKIYTLSAPYIKGPWTTNKIMLSIIFALLPAGIHGIWRYGTNAGLVIAVTCGSAVLTEYLVQMVMKKPVTMMDLKSLLTGLLVAYCMPPQLPLYLAVLAGVLCALIIEVSEHFMKRNIVSPVILTRLIMMLLFEKEMTTYVFDGITMATPLATLKADGTVNTLYMIFGNVGGCIGESSTILLCLGAIFLIMIGLMDFRVTGMYLLFFAVVIALFGGHGLSSYYLTAHMAGGGFMLALWFIAPAFSILPITKGGRLLYGIVLGLLTGFFRLFGPDAENLCYAILLANLLVPVIEKITIPRPFGVEKGRL